MCMRFSIKIKSVRLKPSSSLSCDETRCEQKAERDSETDREKKATEINIRHQVPATRLRNGFRVARAHILILAQFSFVSSFFFSTRSAYTLQIEKIVIERNMSTIFSLLLFRTTLGTWHMTTHTLHEHDHERFGWCECECVCVLSIISVLLNARFNALQHRLAHHLRSCRNSDTSECLSIWNDNRVCSSHLPLPHRNPCTSLVCRVHHL